MKCFRKIYFTTPNDSYFVRVLLENSFSSEFVEGVHRLYPRTMGKGIKTILLSEEKLARYLRYAVNRLRL